jgi:hypothetical protein
MCAAVARRNLAGGQKIETLDPIDCAPMFDSVYFNEFNEQYSCSSALYWADAGYGCGLSDDAINSGQCQIKDEIADACLTFVPPTTGFRGVRVYAYSDTLTDVNSNIEIPGLYDSIYRLKDLMNKEFKESNLKVVMGDTYGWEVDVVLTARDGLDHNGAANYKYLTHDSEKDVKNYEGEKVKSSTPNYVVPLFLPTKDVNQKVNKSYIKDLEYINQISEIRSVYFAN